MLESAPFPENWFEATREKTLRAVEEIRSGRVEARPANAENCRFCDARDICRFEVRQAAEKVDTQAAQTAEGA